MLDLRHDLAYAVRTLRRSPGFTAAVVLVLVLALGLGANAALFSLLDRIFRAPAGVVAPQEIRRLYYIHPHSDLRAFEPANGVMEPMDYPEYAAILSSAQTGVQFAAYDERPDSVEARVGNAVVPAMALRAE